MLLHSRGTQLLLIWSKYNYREKIAKKSFFNGNAESFYFILKIT